MGFHRKFGRIAGFCEDDVRAFMDGPYAEILWLVTRASAKGGIEDLEKAIHCLQLRVEMAKQGTNVTPVGEVTEWGGLGE